MTVYKCLYEELKETHSASENKEIPKRFVSLSLSLSFEFHFMEDPLTWMFDSRNINNNMNKLHIYALSLVYDISASTFARRITRKR